MENAEFSLNALVLKLIEVNLSEIKEETPKKTKIGTENKLNEEEIRIIISLFWLDSIKKRIIHSKLRFTYKQCLPINILIKGSSNHYSILF